MEEGLRWMEMTLEEGEKVEKEGMEVKTTVEEEVEVVEKGL